MLNGASVTTQVNASIVASSPYGHDELPTSTRNADVTGDVWGGTTDATSPPLEEKPTSTYESSAPTTPSQELTASPRRDPASMRRSDHGEPCIFDRSVRRLLRALDEDETSAPETVDRRRKQIATMALLADSTGSSQSDCSRGCADGTAAFCSGQDKKNATIFPNEATPEASGKYVHVVCMHELEATDGLTGQISLLDAPADAPKELLKIPYRSMSAQLLVQVSNDGEVSRVCSIVDTGAAQSAVCARWLKKHPWLWEKRIEATHRFHGITGEPLQTDGVVRLCIHINNHPICIWAHVFTNMHATLLLGASSIVENALVVDGADCSLYPKADPKKMVGLEYKLRVDEDSHQLQLQAQGQVVGLRKLKLERKTRPLCETPLAHRLVMDATIAPATTATEKQAILLRAENPFAGDVHDRMLTVTREFAKRYPNLQVVDTCYSTREKLAYMGVINTGTTDVQLQQGEQIAQSTRFKKRLHSTSNDEGYGRLTFQVQTVAAKKEVTETTLREERGLDLTDCRDLGLPGAPLLTAEQHTELVQVFIDEHEAIAEDPKRPGTSDFMLIRLNTADAPPQASKPYSIPYAYQELVRQEVEKLLRYGLISPVTSAWASPVLVIIKKDHSGAVANIKLATDLRKLNAVTEMDAGAIGEMSEIIDKFNGRPYASCCDIASGYYNFLIHPDDRQKLAFVLPFSVGGTTTFCWNRAPYGVALLPAQFTRAMNTLLEGMHEECSSYLDDITNHTETFSRHCIVLRTMLRRFIMAGIQLKGSKCLILPAKLELLGYDITPEGVRMQKKKCDAWINFPAPTNKKELQTFLGGVAWYRRWMDSFATMTAPLTDLLKKNQKWEWADKQEAAFQAIKQLLASEAFMGFPDYKDPKGEFWVFTDASDVAISGVLMQLQWDFTRSEYRPKVLAHYSKVLSDVQRRWAIYEKESVAMMMSITHWRKYLLGRKFTCFVDSTVAMTMLSKQRHTSKMQRWGLLLQEYLPAMQIGFKRSADNAADIHSREPTFAKYVPQPSNELVLDDSLFERVYQLPTILRGKFDLLQPRKPELMDTIWGVAATERPTEMVAVVESLATQEAKAAHSFLHNARRQAADNVSEANGRLMRLESLLCGLVFDDTTRVRSDAEIAFEVMMDHYSHYIAAFQAMEHKRPTIIIVGGGCDDVHDGLELAGCAISKHDASIPSFGGGQAIYASDSAYLHQAAALGTLMRALQGHNLPLHVDHRNEVHAVNFDIHQPSVAPRGNASTLVQTAEEQWRQRVDGGHHEYSVPNIHQRDGLPPTAHGQLLAGQLVAVYMHRTYGMPLWTSQQAVHDPMVNEHLKSWASQGFFSANVDTDIDEEWEQLIHPEQLRYSPARILRRVGPPPQPPSYTTLPRTPLLTPAEKERLYQEARARIFASVEDGTLVDAPQQPPAPPAPIIPQPSEVEISGEIAIPSDADYPLKPITAQEQQLDPALQVLLKLLQSESTQDPNEAKRISTARNRFCVGQDGLIMQRAMRFNTVQSTAEEVSKPVVPLQRRQALLKHYHTATTGGHRGYKALYEIISHKYYWSGLYSDCIDFVDRCEVCAVRRPFQAKYANEARVTQTPPRPFHSLAIDIKGPLPTTTNNNTYILVVVCLLTRFVVAIPLVDTTSETIARALVTHVFSLHGACYSMQMDNAAYFTSTTMKALTELFGIKHITVLPYQPTANGSAEAVVKRVSNMLQRHSNAFRRWDNLLPLVVHGLNCTEVNQLGCTPFYALFGRDPVGLAELAWPDIQKLDTDGSDFVSNLAGHLRTIWTELKNESDKRKREAAERVNASRSEAQPRPLKPGDYVFVEYGDDAHSKRLGKAGLPRRRRFKVLEYLPERGYVRIDPDGVNILDKISVSRITRAPDEFSVHDTSVPLTKIERKGQADMQLPPGWVQIVRKGKTQDFVEYTGPGGDGRAKSVPQAWIKFNSDALIMPQPRTSAPATLPPVLPVPPTPANQSASSITLRLPSHPTDAQANAISSALYHMVLAGVSASKKCHGWHLCTSANSPSSDTSILSWQVTAPGGEQATNAEALVKLLGANASKLKRLSDDANPTAPAVGDRVKIYWTDEKQWYDGVILNKARDYGDLVHRIRYDVDQSRMWHDMSAERWERASSTTHTSLAHIAFTDIMCEVGDLRRKRKSETEQKRNNDLMPFIWDAIGAVVPYVRHMSREECALGVCSCCTDYDGPWYGHPSHAGYPLPRGSDRLHLNAGFLTAVVRNMVERGEDIIDDNEKERVGDDNDESVNDDLVESGTSDRHLNTVINLLNMAGPKVVLPEIESFTDQGHRVTHLAPRQITPDIWDNSNLATYRQIWCGDRQRGFAARWLHNIVEPWTSMTWYATCRKWMGERGVIMMGPEYDVIHLDAPDSDREEASFINYILSCHYKRVVPYFQLLLCDVDPNSDGLNEFVGNLNHWLSIKEIHRLAPYTIDDDNRMWHVTRRWIVDVKNTLTFVDMVFNMAHVWRLIPQASRGAYWKFGEDMIFYHVAQVLPLYCDVLHRCSSLYDAAHQSMLESSIAMARFAVNHWNDERTALINSIVEDLIAAVIQRQLDEAFEMPDFGNSLEAVFRLMEDSSHNAAVAAMIRATPRPRTIVWQNILETLVVNSIFDDIVDEVVVREAVEIVNEDMADLVVDNIVDEDLDHEAVDIADGAMDQEADDTAAMCRVRGAGDSLPGSSHQHAELPPEEDVAQLTEALAQLTWQLGAKNAHLTQVTEERDRLSNGVTELVARLDEAKAALRQQNQRYLDQRIKMISDHNSRVSTYLERLSKMRADMKCLKASMFEMETEFGLDHSRSIELHLQIRPSDHLQEDMVRSVRQEKRMLRDLRKRLEQWDIEHIRLLDDIEQSLGSEFRSRIDGDGPKLARMQRNIAAMCRLRGAGDSDEPPGPSRRHAGLPPDEDVEHYLSQIAQLNLQISEHELRHQQMKEERDRLVDRIAELSAALNEKQQPVQEALQQQADMLRQREIQAETTHSEKMKKVWQANRKLRVENRILQASLIDMETEFGLNHARSNHIGDLIRNGTATATLDYGLDRSVREQRRLLVALRAKLDQWETEHARLLTEIERCLGAVFRSRLEGDGPSSDSHLKPSARRRDLLTVDVRKFHRLMTPRSVNWRLTWWCPELEHLESSFLQRRVPNDHYRPMDARADRAEQTGKMALENLRKHVFSTEPMEHVQRCHVIHSVWHDKLWGSEHVHDLWQTFNKQVFLHELPQTYVEYKYLRIPFFDVTFEKWGPQGWQIITASTQEVPVHHFFHWLTPQRIRELTPFFDACFERSHGHYAFWFVHTRSILTVVHLFLNMTFHVQNAHFSVPQMPIFTLLVQRLATQWLRIKPFYQDVLARCRDLFQATEFSIVCRSLTLAFTWKQYTDKLRLVNLRPTPSRAQRDRLQPQNLPPSSLTPRNIPAEMFFQNRPPSSDELRHSTAIWSLTQLIALAYDGITMPEIQLILIEHSASRTKCLLLEAFHRMDPQAQKLPTIIRSLLQRWQRDEPRFPQDVDVQFNSVLSIKHFVDISIKFLLWDNVICDKLLLADPTLLGALLEQVGCKNIHLRHFAFGVEEIETETDSNGGPTPTPNVALFFERACHA